MTETKAHQNLTDLTFDDKITSLIRQIEVLLQDKFPAAQTDKIYFKVCLKELARQLQKYADRIIV